MSEIPPIPPRNTVEYESRFEPLLDSDEAAALLKIHPKTLQRMARRGEVPAIQIGKLWRFRASELDAWMGNTAGHGSRQNRRDNAQIA